ncbi:hypothetical protein D3C72_1371210 [compost metagenome]|jgi:hypothetical protein
MYPVLKHPWGEFVYSFSGVTEVKAGAEREHLFALLGEPGGPHRAVEQRGVENERLSS